MGIGAIPDAVLTQLGNHKDLGIHSEMFSDGVVDLLATGAITNNKKVIHQGKLVSSFTIGTQKLFNWMHNNPSLVMLDTGFTNNPQVSYWLVAVVQMLWILRFIINKNLYEFWNPQ